jgi:protein ImuA
VKIQPDRRSADTPRDPFALASTRVHEAAGPGRRAFALFQAARHPGPLVWVLPAHQHQRPLPAGLPQGVADRLLLIEARSETDLLWSVEECLRAGPLGLVLAEPEKPLSLTAGRRLQLAAEAGRTPGLMLIREGQGSTAAETRWACDPISAPWDSTGHQWRLIKNKKGTTGLWTVHWDGTSTTCHMVSEAVQ